MELHQLRYFVTVVRDGTFTKAAEHLYITQPSLSEQIRKLETELGSPLFQRLGRRLLAEVAIAWTLRQPEVTAAIVGGRRPQQVEEIIGAGDFWLSQDEIAELESRGSLSYGR